MKNNVTDKSNSVIITDNFLLGNLIKETINAPMIAFQNISNSYIILKEIERINIKDILFVIRLPQANENLDYIINRLFRDLIPLNYNLDIKYINVLIFQYILSIIITVTLILNFEILKKLFDKSKIMCYYLITK